MDQDSEAHFEAFVEARSAALLGTACLLTGDRHRAEDLLQSALVKAHRHWARVRAEGNVEPYVRRIMVNEQRSWWRSRREYPVAEVPDRPTSSGDPAGISERDAVWQALRRLPPRTRAVLVLRYWEDLSEAETARILDCSVGSVKSQASRGLRRLAEVLGEAGTRPARTRTGGAG
ncbi:MAG TPA: SigE family RNA polymerase sigma factor [Mycobacteriales bacterium]|jgi:RNA polymerase sigma-70 factor (sigma-E family)|nr:SigE family RNA polymerase sigma factor [Mycobacteriales bacterium]